MLFFFSENTQVHYLYQMVFLFVKQTKSLHDDWLDMQISILYLTRTSVFYQSTWLSLFNTGVSLYLNQWQFGPIWLRSSVFDGKCLTSLSVFLSFPPFNEERMKQSSPSSRLTLNLPARFPLRPHKSLFFPPTFFFCVCFVFFPCFTSKFLRVFYVICQKRTKYFVSRVQIDCRRLFLLHRFMTPPKMEVLRRFIFHHLSISSPYMRHFSFCGLLSFLPYCTPGVRSIDSL